MIATKVIKFFLESHILCATVTLDVQQCISKFDLSQKLKNTQERKCMLSSNSHWRLDVKDWLSLGMNKCYKCNQRWMEEFHAKFLLLTALAGLKFHKSETIFCNETIFPHFAFNSCWRPNVLQRDGHYT